MSLVLLAGLGLAGLSTFLPKLGERVTDTKGFTIKLKVAEVPEATIRSVSFPGELEAGKIPTVAVTVDHNRERWEYVFCRIRDRDTGEVVTPMKTHYFTGKGSTIFRFETLRDWKKPMPNHDWRLVVETGLWWL